MIRCPKCGHENSDKALNCDKCHINLQFALQNLEQLRAQWEAEGQEKSFHERIEFRIKRETPIRWPDKCVWCSDFPTKKMGAQAGWIWQKKVKVEYPLCSKHYFWIKGTQVIYWVIFVIWISPLSRMPYDLIFTIMVLLISILSIVFKPVKIKLEGDFYTLKIRNEDYAREFGMLNNLAPV